MKIGVWTTDPLLTTGLVDLLRAHGHEVRRRDQAGEACDLRIVAGRRPDGPLDCPTLVLARRHATEADTDPGEALRGALRTGSTCTWRSPLDTHLLLEVLAEGLEGGEPEPVDEPARIPDLGSARHAWALLDHVRGRVVAANAEARALLSLPGDGAGAPVAGLPFGPRLRDALAEYTDGVLITRVAGTPHLVAWWTDPQGHRAVCCLPPPTGSPHADRKARALAELGQVAATLAHEIRNPVASLAGALELLEHEEDAAERGQILAMAKARLDHLSRLLERTLSLARPIRGEPEAVDLQAVIASAVSTVRLDPRFARVEIAVDAPDAIIRVQAHESLLLQALLNLLINAAQVQGGEGRIEVSVVVDHGRALLRVQDEGPGIPPAKREEVFQPFYTTRIDGTGLGLAEVRRTLEAADGEIEIVDSARGACFALHLPLA